MVNYTASQRYRARINASKNGTPIPEWAKKRTKSKGKTAKSSPNKRGTNEYKDFIKSHKKTNCPPFSKLRKAALVALAHSFGYDDSYGSTVDDYKDFLREYKADNCPAISKLSDAQLVSTAQRLGHKSVTRKTTARANIKIAPIRKTTKKANVRVANIRKTTSKADVKIAPIRKTTKKANVRVANVRKTTSKAKTSTAKLQPFDEPLVVAFPEIKETKEYPYPKTFDGAKFIYKEYDIPLPLGFNSKQHNVAYEKLLRKLYTKDGDLRAGVSKAQVNQAVVCVNMIRKHLKLSKKRSPARLSPSKPGATSEEKFFRIFKKAPMNLAFPEEEETVKYPYPISVAGARLTYKDHGVYLPLKFNNKTHTSAYEALLRTLYTKDGDLRKGVSKAMVNQATRSIQVLQQYLKYKRSPRNYKV